MTEQVHNPMQLQARGPRAAEHRVSTSSGAFRSPSPSTVHDEKAYLGVKSRSFAADAAQRKQLRDLKDDIDDEVGRGAGAGGGGDAASAIGHLDDEYDGESKDGTVCAMVCFAYLF